MAKLDKDSDFSNDLENTSLELDDLEFIEEDLGAKAAEKADAQEEKSEISAAFDEMEQLDNRHNRKGKRRRRRVWPIVLIIIVIVLVGGYFACKYLNILPGSQSQQTEQTATATTEQTDTEDSSVDQNISALITNYLSAYVTADFKSLPEYASPVSEAEQGFISTCAEYIESYNDIKCIRSDGPSEDTYFVMVTDSMKYKDADTERPQALYFYIYKDSDGRYQIDNLYSLFNRRYMVEEMDADIYNAFKEYLDSDTVKEAQAEIDKQSEEALSSDKNTKAAADQLSKALAKWEGSQAEELISLQQESGNDLTDAKTVTIPKKEITEKKASGTVYAKTAVNIRKKPSKNAALINTVKQGKKLTVTAKTSNGWYKVKYTMKKKSHTGYVKAAYVKKKK